jgi:hypothetical protein
MMISLEVNWRMLAFEVVPSRMWARTVITRLLVSRDADDYWYKAMRGPGKRLPGQAKSLPSKASARPFPFITIYTRL